VAELVFPIAAIALTFFVLVPVLTLASRRALERRRRLARIWADFGSASTYAMIVGPTLVPVVWLVSSTLHELEAGTALHSCLLDHSDPTCIDTLLLCALLSIGAVAVFGSRLWLERRAVRPQTLPESHILAGRLVRVAARHPNLLGLPILAVHGSATPVSTRGLFKPRILVDSCFMREADDEMLLAALLHELAHVRGRDTVRVFLAQICLALNPASRLLEPEFARWRQAREAGCDADAVASGGDALALADSILSAARFDCQRPCHAASVGLCGRDHTALRLRVMLLVEGSRCTSRSFGAVALLLFALASAAAPHVEGLELLSAFHLEVERLLHHPS